MSRRQKHLKVQWNLDLVTLLVTRKTVTKSRVVTKFIACAYRVSIMGYSKIKLQMLHLNGFYPSWTAPLCFLKCKIWSQMFLSKILHFMTVSLYEQWPCVSSKIELQILHLYSFLPSQTAPLCFLKSSYFKICIYRDLFF